MFKLRPLRLSNFPWLARSPAPRGAVFAGLATASLLGLSACGSSGHPAGTYVDAKYGFSLKIPKGWSTSPSTGTGSNGYHVQFTNPLVRIAVGPSDPQLNSIRNGEVIKNQPPSCPHTCIWTFAKVDRFHAVQQQMINGPVFFADYFFFNTKRHLYTVELRLPQISHELYKRFVDMVLSFNAGSNG